MTTNYKIAGLNVEVHHSGDACPLNDIPGFAVFQKDAADGPVKLSYSIDSAADPDYISNIEYFKAHREEFRKIYEFDFEGEEILCSLFIKGTLNIFCMAPAGAPEFYFETTPIEGETLVVKSNWEEVRNTSILRFSLWMAYAMCGLMNNAIAIHSSTIVCWDADHKNGKAALFLGESGTGKSTHTRLYLNNIEGSRLLNDDCPIIKVEEDGTVNAYGSPWSGKTHCYHDRVFPVAGLCRLAQAPHNAIRRLGVLEAISALYPSCPPALVRQPYFNGKVCGILSGIIESVGIWHLDCLPDADAAKTSYSKIFIW